jgi:FMN-dependent NADH-azoreductase
MSNAVPTLLHIEASPRTERSHSRRVAAEYVAAWRGTHPGGRVLRRDLAAEPPPYVNEAWVVGAFAPINQQTPASRAASAISDRYIDELLAADELLIATPMYNLTVPAVLKAWIDQVVRAGRTFAPGPNGYQGLARGKRARVVVASGNDFRAGSPAAAYDFLSPYLRGILGFIGIDDVDFIHAHSLNSESTRPAALAEAADTAKKLAAA